MRAARERRGVGDASGADAGGAGSGRSGAYRHGSALRHVDEEGEGEERRDYSGYVYQYADEDDAGASALTDDPGPRPSSSRGRSSRGGVTRGIAGDAPIAMATASLAGSFPPTKRANVGKAASVLEPGAQRSLGEAGAGVAVGSREWRSLRGIIGSSDSDGEAARAEARPRSALRPSPHSASPRLSTPSSTVEGRAPPQAPRNEPRLPPSLAALPAGSVAREAALVALIDEYESAVEGLAADRELLKSEVARVLALERERCIQLKSERAEREGLAEQMRELKRAVLQGTGAESVVDQLRSENGVLKQRLQEQIEDDAGARQRSTIAAARRDVQRGDAGMADGGEDTRAALQDARRRNQELQKENAMLQERALKLRRQQLVQDQAVAANAAAVRRAEDAEARASAAEASAKAANEEAKAALAHSADHTSSVAREREDDKAQLCSLEAKLAAALSDLQAAQADSIALRERAEADVGARKELEEINERLVEEALACTNLEGDMQREAQALREQLQAAECARDQALEARAECDARCCAAEREIDGMRERLVCAERDSAQMAETRVKLAEADAAVTAAKREQWNLQLKLESVAPELARLEEVAREGRIAAERAERDAEDARAELASEFRERLRKLHSDSDAMRGELNALSAGATRQAAAARAQAAEVARRAATDARRADVAEQRCIDASAKLQQQASTLQETIDTLTREKDSLVREVNVRSQELVDERGEGEAKRRTLTKRVEELERLLYNATKEKEELMGTFRTERNAWSDRLRESKLKVAREEADRKSAVADIEKQRDRSSERAAEFERALHAQQADYSRLKAELDTLDRQLKDATREAADARREATRAKADADAARAERASAVAIATQPKERSTSSSGAARGGALSPRGSRGSQAPIESDRTSGGLADAYAVPARHEDRAYVPSGPLNPTHQAALASDRSQTSADGPGAHFSSEHAAPYAPAYGQVHSPHHTNAPARPSLSVTPHGPTAHVPQYAPPTPSVAASVRGHAGTPGYVPSGASQYAPPPPFVPTGSGSAAAVAHAMASARSVGSSAPSSARLGSYAPPPSAAQVAPSMGPYAPASESWGAPGQFAHRPAAAQFSARSVGSAGGYEPPGGASFAPPPHASTPPHGIAPLNLIG